MSQKKLIGVSGATGRIGSLVAELLKSSDHFSLGAIFDKDGARCLPDLSRAIDLNDCVGKCAAWIDFSVPQAALMLAECAAAKGVPLLIGTTGIEAAGIERLKALASKCPIALLPNTSHGVFALRQAAKLLSEILGHEYETEIMEIHHRSKRDIPSGTALALASDISAMRSGTIQTARTGKREIGEIGVAGLRGGDVPGEHTIYFLGPDERIELTHRAGSPRLFARGALKALKSLVSKGPGFYEVKDLFYSSPEF